MQNILRKGASLFTPSPSRPSSAVTEAEGSQVSGADGFKSISSHDNLFTRTNPVVDGEECLHDCSTCTIKYPAKFEVDMEDELFGHVNGWATHLLVATGKTDWVRDVADEKGSVMEAVDRGGVEPSNGNLKLSASNIPVPDEYHHSEAGQQPTTVLLLPSFTIIDHVTPGLVPDLIKYFVNRAPTTTTPLGSLPPPAPEAEPASEPSPEQDNHQDLTSLTPLRPRTSPHSAVILLCSQKTRDARCGQSAPLLKREFERHLRPMGLYRDLDDERPGGVGIYFISHVGGHKYAANVIVYRRRDFDWHKKSSNGEKNGDGEGEKDGDEGASQGIWLARVKPEDCENIIRYTVLQGKVVKPGIQLRGGFDRERRLISW